MWVKFARRTSVIIEEPLEGTTAVLQIPEGLVAASIILNLSTAPADDRFHTIVVLLREAVVRTLLDRVKAKIMSATLQNRSLSVTPIRARWALLIGLLAAIAWAYWPTLSALVQRSAQDPRYSHGYLVPAFAIYLVWSRRRSLMELPSRPTMWGLPLAAIGAGLHLLAGAINFDWLAGVAFVPLLAGIVALIWGWRALRIVGPALAFLVFMVPLPYRMEYALGWQLQRFATISSTYMLQVLGFPALGEGNVIILDNGELGVAEACSGLSMLVLFVALATGVAMLVRRPLIDRLLIVASAVPIALIANISRITLTGVLHETVGGKVADAVYHDLAGWLMMPLALALLGLELWFLSHLFLELEPASPTIPIVPVEPRLSGARKSSAVN